MGSVVLSSTYSTSMTGSMTCNMRITYSETWNSSTRKTTVKITKVEIQKVNNGTNWGSMTLRGYISCNGTNLVSFGAGSASVTISLSGSGYCSVSGFSSSSIAVSHDASGAASVTFATVKYGSMAVIGAFYNSSTQFGVKAQSKSVALTKRAPRSYSIMYDSNGHGTSPSTQTKLHGTDITLWNYLSNQTEQGAYYTYTITGNANGGSWSGSNGSASRRVLVTYRQTDWNTNSSGTGSSFASGATFSGNASLYLYAIWTSSASNSFTYSVPTGTPSKNESVKVTFNANGGTTTKTSANASRAMVFDGWYTAATGGTKRTSTSTVGADETVYAHYSSGSGNYSSVTMPTKAQCTRDGYSLLGFATSSTATAATYAPGASYTPTAAITFYAVFFNNKSALFLRILGIF